MATHIFKENASPFAYELPYWALEDDCVVHVDGSYTRGLVLSGLDTWTLSNGLLNEIAGHLRSLMSSLPEEVYFQFFLMSDENVTEDLLSFYKKLNVRSELQELILKDRKQVLESALSRRYRLFLFVTKRHQSTQKTLLQKIIDFFRWLTLNKNLKPLSIEKRHEEISQELARTCNTVITHFRQPHLQIQIRPMQRKELFDLLYEILNPRKHKFKTVS